MMVPNQHQLSETGPPQALVADKTNELTAICQLPNCLELESGVVSIDALDYQTDIAQSIADGTAGTCWPRDNQSGLHANLQRDFVYLARPHWWRPGPSCWCYGRRWPRGGYVNGSSGVICSMDSNPERWF